MDIVAIFETFLTFSNKPSSEDIDTKSDVIFNHYFY